MKIATFNANSIRVRMPILLDWLAAHQPDVLAIQETKVEDKDFPVEEFRESGWQVAYHGQKSRNGIALASRVAPEDVVCGFADPEWPEDCRVMTARFGRLRVINTYVPNGTAVGTAPFTYKLEWLDRLALANLERFDPSQPVIWLGDINIAPTPLDVFDSRRHFGKVGHHPDEFAALERVVRWGWVDVFRKFHPDAREFTFWDYRLPKSFERNLGWRIDHIYASPALAGACTGCRIDREPRSLPKPSDHTFVVAEFDWPPGEA